MNENQTKVFKPTIEKIEKIESVYPTATFQWRELNEKKNNFLNIFKNDQYKFSFFAVLAFAVLIFDYIVNNTVLIWLSKLTSAPVEFFAIIFLIIDASVAVIASGVFAKDEADKYNTMKTWRAVLWSLALLKVIIFIIYVLIYNKNYDPILLLVQVGFIFSVYTILHLTGSGLGMVIGKMWFGISELWYEDPNELNQKYRSLWSEIDNKSKRFDKSIDEIEKHFGVKRKESLNA